MADIPVCSGDDVIGVFEKIGLESRSSEGSHVTLISSGSVVLLTVPMHRELGAGILRSLLRKAGLSVGEFTDFAAVSLLAAT